MKTKGVQMKQTASPNICNNCKKYVEMKTIYKQKITKQKNNSKASMCVYTGRLNEL